MNSATLLQSILAAIVLASPSIAESEAPAPPSVVVAPATLQELQKQEECPSSGILGQIAT